MPDMLQSGVAWAMGQLKTNASQTFAFSRPGTPIAIPALQVTLGKTPFRMSDTQGRTRLVWSDADFVATLADMVYNGTPVIPQAGDRFTRPGETYEVSPYNNEPVYTTDAQNIEMRIHTKKVG